MRVIRLGLLAGREYNVGWCFEHFVCQGCFGPQVHAEFSFLSPPALV